MRLLYLVDLSLSNFYPLLTEVFGKRLQERGHEVIWVTRPEGDEGYHQTTIHGQQAYVLPRSEYSEIRSFTKYLTHRSHTSHVFEIFEKHQPIDCVQVRNDLSMALAASTLQRRTGCHFVHRITHLKAETTWYMARNGQSMHPARDYLKAWSGRRLRDYLANRADLVLPISEAMETELSTNITTTSMEPLPTGVDTELDRSDTDPQLFRDRFDIGDREIILYIGSMSPSRNLEFLLEVIQQLDMDGRVLAMVGGRDSEHRNRLRSMSRKMGIADSVLFTGWLEDRKMVYNANAAAAVGVNPLPTNNILRTSAPIKVLEYLLFETPVVVSDAPDQRRVVEDSNSGFVVPYSVGPFAEALSKFFDLTPTERSTMGASGRAYVKCERGFDRLTEQLLGIYSEYGLLE
jgi:glycosyltransferase involved in cell wall biosynthesis